MAARDLVESLIRGGLIGLLVVSPVLAPAVIFWTARWLYGVRLLARARRWQRASGRIVSSELHRRSPDDWPRARVTYSYNVDEQEYHSHRVRLLRLRRRATGVHRQTAERYRAGQTVTVHYDPKSPRRSALELTAADPSDVPAWLVPLTATSALAGVVAGLAYHLVKS